VITQYAFAYITKANGSYNTYCQAKGISWALQQSFQHAVQCVFIRVSLERVNMGIPISHTANIYVQSYVPTLHKLHSVF